MEIWPGKPYPLGATWYDLRTHEQHTGPRTVLAAAPLEQLPPFYLRGGAIVPFGPSLQWTDQQPLDPLTLQLHPDEQGTADGVLYEDDGQSFAYQQDTFCSTRFRCRRTRDGALQVIAERDGSYRAAQRTVEIALFGNGEQRVVHRERDSDSWAMEV